MQSKTSCFNPTIFRKNILRFWPIWCLYLILWLLILPAMIGSITPLQMGESIHALEESVLSLTVASGPVMTIIFGCASAMAVFSFLYNSRSVGLMAALPLRREGLYMTSVLSGLAWLLGSNVLVFLVSLAVSAAGGVSGLAGALLAWLGVVSLETLLFYGFACFCAMLTGHLVVLPAVYAVLNFTAVAAEMVVKEILSTFVYGAAGRLRDFTLVFLSPFVQLTTSGGVATVFDETSGELSAVQLTLWPALAVYGTAGLLFLLAGLLIYRRRQMETASEVVAVAPLRPVFKYALAGGSALVLGRTFYDLIFRNRHGFGGMDLAFYLLLCMLVGGFIGYFAAEMLNRKSFRVFGAAWKGFAVFSLLLIIMVVGLEKDVLGYERRIPAAEQVESVMLSMDGQSATLREAENVDAALQFHQAVISGKKENEAALKDGANYHYCRLEYMLKDGGCLYREYELSFEEPVPPESVTALAGALLNTDEAIQGRKALSIPVTADTVSYATVDWYDPESGEGQSLELTREEAAELYNTCLLPDIEDGNLGRIWLVTDQDYLDTVYNASISISLSQAVPGRPDGGVDYRNDYFETTPLRISSRTVAWLEAKGVPLMLVGEAEELENSSKEVIDVPAASTIRG